MAKRRSKGVRWPLFALHDAARAFGRKIFKRIVEQGQRGWHDKKVKDLLRDLMAQVDGLDSQTKALCTELHAAAKANRPPNKHTIRRMVRAVVDVGVTTMKMADLLESYEGCVGLGFAIDQLQGASASVKKKMRGHTKSMIKRGLQPSCTTKQFGLRKDRRRLGTVRS